MDKSEKYKNVLSKEEVLTIIESDLNTKNFDLLNYVIKPATETPMGYLGNHLKIKANVTTANKNTEMIYFVKKIPTEVPQHFDYAIKSRAFYKEIELYKTLFKDLKDAQDPEISTKWAPEYYYSRESEILVTEDATLSGHYVLPERTLMNEEHVKATLKVVAAMHAASFVFEEKFNQSEIGHRSPFFTKKEGKVDIGDIYNHLKFEVEVNDQPGNPGFRICTAGIKSELAIVDLLPGYSEAAKEKLKKTLPERLQNIFQLVKSSTKYRNIFIHGDLWANNLMFRKDESRNVQALLIDFQLVRHAPPGQDIMFFLHHCQNRSFRIAKQSELIKYYYEAFSEEMKKNGLDAKSLLPFETLMESCEYYDEFGLLMSVINYPLILVPSEITSKFLTSPELFEKNMFIDRSEMITNCYLTNENFRVRCTETLNEAIEKYNLI